jgi:hypothetical protein
VASIVGGLPKPRGNGVRVSGQLEVLSERIRLKSTSLGLLASSARLRWQIAQFDPSHGALQQYMKEANYSSTINAMEPQP